MSSSQLVEEYKKFDFEKNEDFNKFLKEMNPPVPQEAMELVKRHWYKGYINKDFVPNFDGKLPDFDVDDEQEHTHDGKKCTGNHGPHGHHDHKHGSSQKPEEESGFKQKLKRIAYKIENFLKMIFMMTTFWMQGIAHYISVTICILAIIRQLKTPRLTKQYVQKLSQNQFAQNLIYVLVFCFYRDQRNIFYFFPLMIHFWVGICEYLNIEKNRLYKQGESLINRTRQSKDSIFLLKSQYEIFYFPVLFVEIFFGRSSIFLVIFYYNFLKFKYLINDYTQKAFQKLNNFFKSAATAPGVPAFVGKLYGYVESLFGWFVKHGSSKKNATTPPPTQADQQTEESKKQEEKASNPEKDQKESNEKKSQ